MIAVKNKYIIFLTLFVALFFTGCKDKWDQHDQIQDPMLAINLLNQIKSNPDLSKFADLLTKTKYDKIVASSKTFTIWAPNNLAITNMDQTILADTTKLKQFVANHISNQSYLTSMASTPLTIRTLNGKNIVFSATTFEEAKIITADRYVGNGILHVIDKAIVPKPNAWEYLNSTAASMQKTFIQKLNYSYVDPTLATQTGVDPKTGLPIYKPGTGVVSTNYFLQRAANVNSEDVKYTYVILTDAAYAAEKAKLSKYFAIVNPNATPGVNAALSDSLTNWAINKDLAFKGDFSVNMPDTITSVDSVRVHLDPSAIVETHKVSNGVVYVMSRIDYQMASKMKPVYIQGPNMVSSPSTAATIFASTVNSYKNKKVNTRFNPLTNSNFTEIYYYTSTSSLNWVHYYPLLNSVTYKVYWLAVRDFNTTATPPAVPLMFKQAVTFGTPTVSASLPYTQVDILNYNEVYLGNYTATAYGNLDTFLVSAVSTTDGANTIVLAYIKLVPVLN